MSADQPTSVLFCCDYNSVRSPMAEGIMKKLHGHRIYVQSAGVRHEQEIDGCDCPIEEADATPDEDLPAADGGVA